MQQRACAVAEKTFDEAEPTTEDQPVSLYHDSPYSISKIIGELYGNYYWERHDLPFVKSKVFECVWTTRDFRCWKVARHRPYNLEKRCTNLHLAGSKQ